eukprot:Nitzschia sp. Nitz4//scaffold6_size259037//161312//161728//NITZ4_001089-RA/size259037-processed-gene-0.272-mRNA-1//-1//CDS//3329556938//2717//frame0
MSRQGQKQYQRDFTLHIPSISYSEDEYDFQVEGDENWERELPSHVDGEETQSSEYQEGAPLTLQRCLAWSQEDDQEDEHDSLNFETVNPGDSTAILQPTSHRDNLANLPQYRDMVHWDDQIQSQSSISSIVWEQENRQ